MKWSVKAASGIRSCSRLSVEFWPDFGIFVEEGDDELNLKRGDANQQLMHEQQQQQQQQQDALRQQQQQILQHQQQQEQLQQQQQPNVQVENGQAQHDQVTVKSFDSLPHFCMRRVWHVVTLCA